MARKRPPHVSNLETMSTVRTAPRHETSIPATVETRTAPISTPDTQHVGIYRILCHHYHVAGIASTTTAPPCHGDLQPCLTKYHGTKTSTACLKPWNNVNSADCPEHETSIPATAETRTAPISTPETQHAGIYRILCHHYHFAGLASTTAAPPCHGDLQPCLTKHHGTKTSTACLKPWNNVNSADCSEHETSIPATVETRSAPISTPDTQHVGIYRILRHHYHVAGIASTTTAPPCHGDLQPCLTKHHGTKTSTACLKPWNNVNSADCLLRTWNEHTRNCRKKNRPCLDTRCTTCFNLQQLVASLPLCKSSLNNM